MKFKEFLEEKEEISNKKMVKHRYFCIKYERKNYNNNLFIKPQKHPYLVGVP